MSATSMHALVPRGEDWPLISCLITSLLHRVKLCKAIWSKTPLQILWLPVSPSPPAHPELVILVDESFVLHSLSPSSLTIPTNVQFDWRSTVVYGDHLGMDDGGHCCDHHPEPLKLYHSPQHHQHHRMQTCISIEYCRLQWWQSGQST